MNKVSDLTFLKGDRMIGFHHYTCLSFFRINISKIKNLSRGPLVELIRNDPIAYSSIAQVMSVWEG